MAITFEQWLDTLMETLDLANARVASAGGVDRSLISRYRSGSRVPPDDHVQLKKSCAALWMSPQKRAKPKLYIAMSVTPMNRWQRPYINRP